MIKEISEKDWKIFREKLPTWQEAYIEKLDQEYVDILNSSKSASEKFWELEKRINTDKHKTSVMCDMRRSKMVENILSLLIDKAITVDDLSEFSEDLKSTVSLMIKFYREDDSAENIGCTK